MRSAENEVIKLGLLLFVVVSLSTIIHMYVHIVTIELVSRGLADTGIDWMDGVGRVSHLRLICLEAVDSLACQQPKIYTQPIFYKSPPG